MVVDRNIRILCEVLREFLVLILCHCCLCFDYGCKGKYNILYFQIIFELFFSYEV